MAVEMFVPKVTVKSNNQNIQRRKLFYLDKKLKVKIKRKERLWYRYRHSRVPKVMKEYNSKIPSQEVNKESYQGS